MLLPPSAQGLLTPATAGRIRLHRAVARGQLVRVHPAVYAAAPLPPVAQFLVTPDGSDPAYVRRVRAALLSLGEQSFARGRTAAVLHGWPLLVEPRQAVHAGLPHGRSRAQLEGVRVSQHRKPDTCQVSPVAGADPLTATTPLRTVLDACRELPLEQAVVLTDSALRAGAVTIPALMVAARTLSGSRGARRVRQVIDWADPCSESVLESVQRVRMRRAGLVGFRTQVDLRGLDGRHLRRADFCFPRERLLIEVDGQRWHPDPRVDRVRDNALVACGWRVLRFTWREVMHDWPGVLAQVRSALAADATLQAV